ncbi:MAG: nicotinate-nucleotide--dimethylbenzimidazole phosphoribosyltransferase [Bacteroidota bacterium]
MKPTFHIEPINHSIIPKIKNAIDVKTKPLGALGQLEELALKIAMIQQTTKPKLNNPSLVVFAGDHGIASEGVSKYPKQVTAQMILNFLSGGAAINVFTRQHGINLLIVDAGVDYDFEVYSDQFLNRKARKGTRNMLNENAVTEMEYFQSIQYGKEIVLKFKKEGCNVIGFGEMGIGNTSSASLIMSQILSLPLIDCVGRGTGLDDQGFSKKSKVLRKAKERHQGATTLEAILQAYGGYEIIQMVGAMLQAAEEKMTILIDGFVASAAFLAASKWHAEIKEYTIFCHESAELGHRLLLSKMEVEPLLKLGMRLGEGTGCAVAFPIIQSSVNFLNEMASFESAGVSKDQ